MKINIELSWSKIMALVFMLMAFALDVMNDKGGTVFMYSLPFAVVLITGKQVVDWKKTNKDENNIT